jgi:hypothetical protein
MALKWIAVLFVATVLAIVIWASDKISYEGERTVYSVRCEQGVWEGSRCTGKLVTGDRYRFVASKSRQEVLYWILGSSAPSGKYTDCKVADRGNWTCRPAAWQPPTITHEMVNGVPSRDGGGAALPFHAVSKLQWWLLKVGFHVNGNATH